MKEKGKHLSSTVKLLITLIIFIMCYLIFMTVLGPVLISEVGEILTKITVIITSFITAMFFLDQLRNDNQAESRDGSTIIEDTEGRPKRKYYLLVIGLMAFLMVPLGVAGVLPSRSSGDLPPLWGGGLCLISGIISFYLFFKDRN